MLRGFITALCIIGFYLGILGVLLVELLPKLQ